MFGQVIDNCCTIIQQPFQETLFYDWYPAGVSSEMFMDVVFAVERVGI